MRLAFALAVFAGASAAAASTPVTDPRAGEAATASPLAGHAPSAHAAASLTLPERGPGRSGFWGTDSEVWRERLRERSAALDDLWREIRESAVAVERARKRLQAERAPLPDERAVEENGAISLSPNYSYRVAALEAELATAERRKARAFSDLVLSRP